MHNAPNPQGSSTFNPIHGHPPIFNNADKQYDNNLNIVKGRSSSGQKTPETLTNNNQNNGGLDFKHVQSSVSEVQKDLTDTKEKLKIVT